jgi:hypothetical protein
MSGYQWHKTWLESSGFPRVSAHGFVLLREICLPRDVYIITPNQQVVCSKDIDTLKLEVNSLHTHTHTHTHTHVPSH